LNKAFFMEVLIDPYPSSSMLGELFDLGLYY